METSRRKLLALVNSIGNPGGFVGPYVVGWIKDATGSFEAGTLLPCGVRPRVVHSRILRAAAGRRRRNNTGP
jgi:MFS transporter, ACS family, tartrate transporter